MLPSAEDFTVKVIDLVDDKSRRHLAAEMAALIRADRRAVALECAQIAYDKPVQSVNAIKDYAERLGKGEST